MEQIIKNWLLPNWQRKFLALIAALIIWSFVSHSITSTKTLTGVPIRIVNLPTDKTVEGLLPNGLLQKRLTLVLTGSKQVVDNIESNDLEIILDAANVPDEWIVQVTKKNIVSLNPSIDLLHNLTNVSHQEFVLNLRRLITAKVPITFTYPIGNLPKNYQFLGIWPHKLNHTITGPEEQVLQLKAKGIELTFDLNEISQAELDAIHGLQQGIYADEISFKMPDKWKRINIAFLNDTSQEINDIEAQNLRLDFLRKEFIPLQSSLSVKVFYPVKTIETLNPSTLSLQYNNIIKLKNALPMLATPLFAYEVSRLFVEITRDNMEIELIAIPLHGSQNIPWSLEFIDPHYLEDRYVASLMSHHNLNSNPQGSAAKLRELQWRSRFRDYMQKMVLYKSPSHRLHLSCKMNAGEIVVTEE